MSGQEQYDLSITILSYRNPAMLRMCLNSLAKALPKDITTETIVVDNATIPETQNVVLEEFVDKIPNLRLLPLKENTGYTRGVNEGFRAAKGEYILSLNYDIVVRLGAIKSLLDFHRQHPEIGLIGPELLNFTDTHQDSYFRFYTPLTVVYRRLPGLPGGKKILDSFLMRDSDPKQIVEPDWVSGAAMMVSRKAMEKIGLLNQKLFHYFSDVDWAHRFWENGLKVIYYPGAKLYHYLGRSSKGSFPLWDLIFKREARWHLTDGIRYFLIHGIRPKRK